MTSRRAAGIGAWVVRPPVLAFAATVALLAAGTAAAAVRVVYAGGSWAAVDRGSVCEAASKSLRVAARRAPQARAGFAFDRHGRRRGEFHALLSRAPRPGATVLLTVGNQPFLLAARGQWAWSRGAAQEAAIIAAVRSSSGMRVEARDSAGRRFVDRYLLAGAPTAIDAAAAACSL